MPDQFLSSDSAGGCAGRFSHLLSGLETGADGASISGKPEDEGKIAVVYNHGEIPPEITIHETTRELQTVLADGVAVAIVARADGPRLTLDDIMLIERFRPGAG